jgi:hypothetical protein
MLLYLFNKLSEVFEATRLTVPVLELGETDCTYCRKYVHCSRDIEPFSLYNTQFSL